MARQETQNCRGPSPFLSCELSNGRGGCRHVGSPGRAGVTGTTPNRRIRQPGRSKPTTILLLRCGARRISFSTKGAAGFPLIICRTSILQPRPEFLPSLTPHGSLAPLPHRPLGVPRSRPSPALCPPTSIGFSLLSRIPRRWLPRHRRFRLPPFLPSSLLLRRPLSFHFSGSSFGSRSLPPLFLIFYFIVISILSNEDF